MIRQISLCIAALGGLASPAQAAQILLTPAAVIGSTGGFNATYSADNILDRQTGPIMEAFANGEYWLNPDGRTPAFITIDLGATYRLGSFDLFNSRNLGDRGTAGFEIFASNATATATGPGATGLTLGSDALRVAAGTLVMDSGLYTVAAQTFAALNNGQAYRYIQFRPISPIGSAYGGAAYGLNELRVFEYEAPAAVPEPASWAMMIGGMGLVGGSMRRRRARPSFA